MPLIKEGFGKVWDAQGLFLEAQKDFELFFVTSSQHRKEWIAVFADPL